MGDLHIGFDDTDSPRKGCTTYIAALLVEKLQTLGVTFNDYPNLVRLNPNVPWKTRGNGALCLRITCTPNQAEAAFEIVVDTVEEHSDLGFKATDPGIAFFQGATIPKAIKAFAQRTIQNVVKVEDALKLIKKFEAEAVGFGTGRGIVGALAAIGESLESDYTYEIIAYRTPQNRGSKRRISLLSIREMAQQTTPQTFNNVDPETGRILITPRGPDPILYGIRGETANAVIRAHKMVHSLEPIERWVVFRTNHGTDAHLTKVNAVSDIQPYRSVIVTGTVASMPRLVPKRHRIFALKDQTGTVDCAAYEPTGTLRKVARKLIVGDAVEVSGGVRQSTATHPLTINLEKLQILKLARKLTAQNPKCLKCGKRMKSMGANQGLRCPKCGFQSSSRQKIMVEDSRDIAEKLYITSARSQRHLTKPLRRYGREKAGKSERMGVHWHHLS